MKNEVWVVTVDFTKMDNRVFAYARFLSDYLGPKQIHFIHVIEELKSSSYLPEEFLGLRNMILEDKKLTLAHKVEKYFKESKVPCKYHVISGSPFEEIVDFALSNSAKLVLAGRKKLSSGSGVVSERLSRNLPCDFLLMTEDFKPKLSTILVATDFSNHATLAMQRALNFQNDLGDLKIIAHHSYGVPEDYSKSGISYEEFADLVKIAAKKQMTRWLTRFDQKIESVLTLKDSRSVAQQILDIAKKNHADLIAIGSKGLSKSAIGLMGSNTMKLIRADETIPVYIAKSKKENLKLLDVLRQG